MAHCCQLVDEWLRSPFHPVVDDVPPLSWPSPDEGRRAVETAIGPDAPPPLSVWPEYV